MSDRPSGEAVTCSTSNPPGVSSAGAPPPSATLYRWVQPSASHGNTMRSALGAQNSWSSATISRNTLPFPGLARHTSRDVPVLASATRIDQGIGLSRSGTKMRFDTCDGVRVNASDFESGDHTSAPSWSVLGSTYRSVLATKSQTPTKPWRSRLLTNANRLPSGDQRRFDAPPRSFVSATGFALSPERRTIHTWPPRVNASESPDGESCGDEPSATLRGVPGSTGAIQIA